MLAIRLFCIGLGACIQPSSIKLQRLLLLVRIDDALGEARGDRVYICIWMAAHFKGQDVTQIDMKSSCMSIQCYKLVVA